MFQSFCKIKAPNEIYDYEILTSLNINELDWLENEDLTKAKHIDFLLNANDGTHNIIKISQNNKPITFFLLEIITINLDNINLDNAGFLEKLGSRFFKNNKLNIAIPSYSILYDFDFSISNKKLINNWMKGSIIGQCLDSLQNKLGFDIAVVQSKHENEYNKIDFENLSFDQPIQDFTMELEIQGHWQTFDDYIFSLKKKYQKRGELILKNGSEIIYKDLTLKEIEQYSDKIHSLYLEVIKSQTFVGGAVKIHHFYNLKEIYGDKFSVEALLLNGRFVGFVSYFTFENLLDVHYIGIDYSFNESHDIYFNILFKTIEIAIKQGLTKINYGRTSLDAKASLGAKPIYKTTFIKTYGITKILKTTLINYAKNFETISWKIRKPFKTELVQLEKTY